MRCLHRVLPFVCIFLLLSAATLSAAEKGAIPGDLINKLQDQKLTGIDKAMADVVANKNINEVALNRERFINHNHIVDFKIKTGTTNNQKSSGRCWMYAGFNVLRPPVIEKYKLKDFEFSHSYLMFWDKMEKSNVFLQDMIDLADRELDDRELQIVLDGPLGDGGWWTYFSDLVTKYGCVPNEIMPETHNSSSSGMMNKMVSMKLKEMGMALRKMVREGAKAGDAEKQKLADLEEIYHMLVLNLGQPPKEFTWRYETTDSVGIVTYGKTLTPQTFFRDIVDLDLSEYVSLFDIPGKDYYENYAMRLSRNIYEKPNFNIVNVPIDTVRKYALVSVLDSVPVWFACDVGQENYGKDGILALDIYNYEEIYGTKFSMSKEDLMHTMTITPNHAMTFIGVDTANGGAVKWLVENSWGGDKGDDGNWYMYNGWFDRYLYGIVINTKYLSDDLKKLAKKKPVMLEPWDPMYPLNKLD